MPQPKKKRTGDRSVDRVPSSKAAGKEQTGRRTGITVAALILVVIIVIVVVGYYLIYVRPFQKTVIMVGDETINMSYFLKRMYSGGTATEDPLVMIQMLTEELLIRQGAPRYGIEVSPEEITQELRNAARGDSETLSDSEFNEWYRQQLNASQLSESEYGDLVHTSLLTIKLYVYLTEGVSTTAEQVHLHIIVVESYDDALAVTARYEAGENFPELARETSLDVQSAENGGDIGWLPHGALEDRFAWTAFALDIGQISEPLMYDTEQGTFVIFMVSEKAVAREVDEQQLEILKARTLTDWLDQEHNRLRGLERLEFHGLNNGFDSETYAWIQYQLQKMKR